MYSTIMSQVKHPIEREYWKKQKNIYRNKLRSKIAKKSNISTTSSHKIPTNTKRIFKKSSVKPTKCIAMKYRIKISPTYGFAASVLKNKKN